MPKTKKRIKSEEIQYNMKNYINEFIWNDKCLVFLMKKYWTHAKVYFLIITLLKFLFFFSLQCCSFMLHEYFAFRMNLLMFAKLELPRLIKAAEVPVGQFSRQQHSLKVTMFKNLYETNYEFIKKKKDCDDVKLWYTPK